MRGIAFCHRNRILHRDLKPGNIYIDEKKTIKLGDFGLSRQLKDGSVLAKTHVGTPYYMSPEQMHGQEYNDRSDIWSLGCVMYEIATTYPPFKAKNEIELSKMVKECKIKRTEEFSEDFFDLICEMIQKDHRKRPSA